MDGGGAGGFAGFACLLLPGSRQWEALKEEKLSACPASLVSSLLCQRLQAQRPEQHMGPMEQEKLGA